MTKSFNGLVATALVAVVALSGCKEVPKKAPVDVTQTVKIPATRPAIPQPRLRDGASVEPEFDCRKEAKVCLVPWKDKMVWYCYKGLFPRVVKTREDC